MGSGGGVRVWGLKMGKDGVESCVVELNGDEGWKGRGEVGEVERGGWMGGWGGGG